VPRRDAQDGVKIASTSASVVRHEDTLTRIAVRPPPLCAPARARPVREARRETAAAFHEFRDAGASPRLASAAHPSTRTRWGVHRARTRALRHFRSSPPPGTFKPREAVPGVVPPRPVPRSVIVTLSLCLAALALVYYAARWEQWDVATRVILGLGFVTFFAVLAWADYLAQQSRGRRR
jgi:hypothetical protein